MTEPERTQAEQRQPERPYREPLPGEVPLSPTLRPGGVAPSAQPAPVPESRPVPARVPDRPPSRAQRRSDDRAMVPLLAQALASQFARLAAADDTPDGWWLTPER